MKQKSIHREWTIVIFFSLFIATTIIIKEVKKYHAYRASERHARKHAKPH